MAPFLTREKNGLYVQHYFTVSLKNRLLFPSPDRRKTVPGATGGHRMGAVANSTPETVYCTTQKARCTCLPVSMQ